ncbi:ArsR family transcriptional regulator [Haloarcula sp. S1CR25-12]|uniref:ArsR family transcriptional regulator n=1 Tax=Haloarcula saliterrae TaxID=2950534 RepID=A0ABU2FH13_9EURY|nr:ArsR family transcriptional regulator [Haloarcula sp. S1CR25-12]MDS0261130.1 ArsR family transcriptional regulator [Haloarcula sp. S1CR25-12]
MAYEANRRVKTSARTFEIVERLSRDDHIGVSQLAADLEMTKGIVHNHLSTLREMGYVTKTSDGYRLSPKLLSVGLRARANAQLYRYADGLLTGLAEQLDVGVVLCQEAGTDCVIVATYDVPPRLDTEVGTSFPLTESILGLVLRLSSERAAPADRETEYDLAAIDRELAENAYAIGPLSRGVAVSCVATPIRDDDGYGHGSVGVLLTERQREQHLQRITEATVTLRQQVEKRLRSEWTSERSFATEKHSWIG